MIKNKFLIKSLSILLTICLLLPVFGDVAYAAYDSMTPISVHNDFVEYTVNKSNGRFSIKSKEGSPWKEKDDDANVLYQGKIPETSFTTFKIDGEDYIFGNDYGFMGLDSNFTNSPSTDGLLTESTWRIKGLEITQTLKLYEDIKNPYVGNVKISYKIKNITDEKIDIGTRILLDTMLGANDASPITMAGNNQFISTETELKKNQIPSYWRACDNPFAPKITSYGFLKGWGNTSPDKMVIGHWSGLSETKWDYSVNKNLNFTTENNEYGSPDSAIALYWESSSVNPGQEKTVETFYGLGNFYTVNEKPDYEVKVIAPNKLTLNDNNDGYLENEFAISVEIDNSIDGASDLNDLSVSIELSDELELIKGEKSEKSIDVLSINKNKTITWKVKPKLQNRYMVSMYKIKISAEGVMPSYNSGYIIVPGISGEPPEIQALDMFPHKMHYKEEKKIISIKGNGFALLQVDDDINWDIKLIRERDNTSYTIPKDMVTINPNNLQFTLDEDVFKNTFGEESGRYTIYLNGDKYGTYSQKIEFTTDEKYKSKTYGILLIVGENISPKRESDEMGEEKYKIVTLDSKADLQKYKESLKNTSFENDKQVLLEFSGTITESNDGSNKKYTLENGTTINSVVTFNESDFLKDIYGPFSQTINIETHKSNDSYEKDYIDISGIGILSIPTFPFSFGGFNIKIKNEVCYSLDWDLENDRNPIIVEWGEMKVIDVIQKISNFPVTIRNAIIGDKLVSFGGSLSLDIGGGKDIPKEAQEWIDGADENESKEEKKKNLKEKLNDKIEGKIEKKKREMIVDKLVPEKPSAAIGLEVDDARFGISDKDTLFLDKGAYGFLGLSAEGSVGLPKGLIPGMDVGAEGRLKIDTIENIYELETDISFKVVEIYGLFTLRFTDEGIPIPDNCVFSVGAEPGIPLIPTTPIVFITKGGGGFRNLYDTVTLNFDVLPPLELEIIGGLAIAKVVEGDNLTVNVSARGIKFSGDLNIVKLDILKGVGGHILVEDSLKKFACSVKAEATLDMFDIFVGNAFLLFEYNSRKNGLLGPVELAGGASGAIQIPKYSPILKGKKLADVEAHISTENVYFNSKVGFLDIPVTFKYAWGKSKPSMKVGPFKIVQNDGENKYAFIKNKNALTAGLEDIPYIDDPNGLYHQVVIDSKTDEVKGVITYGSNIRRIASSSGSLIASTNSYMPLIASSMDKSLHNITIDNGYEIVMLEVNSQDENPANIKLYDPNGDEYTLTEDENHFVSTVEAKDSQSGVKEHIAYITIRNPLEGSWQINSDKSITTNLYEVQIPSSLEKVNLTQDNLNISTTWQGDHLSDEKISLYLCNDNVNDPGTKLIDDIDVGLGGYNYTFPESLASGEYYLKAILYKDDTIYDSKYSEEAISIINSNQPSSVRNINVDDAGNGLLMIDWEHDELVDGYYIELLDENGQQINRMGLMKSEGDVKNAVIGGVYEDDEGNEYGLLPNNSYMAKVVAYKTVDDIKYYSEPKYSESIFIKKPEPPKIDIEVKDLEGNLTESTDNEGSMYYNTNKSSVDIIVTTDKWVAGEIILNGEIIDIIEVNSDGASEFKIDLVEGKNDLQLHLISQDADMSIEKATIMSDTRLPELKIESPINGSIAYNGRILVKGLAEADSSVYANGQMIIINDDGSFETEIALEDNLSQYVDIKAVDKAGNETVYSAEISNDNNVKLKSVIIKSKNNNNTENNSVYEIDEGEEINLELYGIDENGDKYQLPYENIKWSFLVGKGLGTISQDGIFRANENGEIILKASYSISDTYAYEDAVTIKVISETNDEDDSDKYAFTPIENNNDEDNNKKSRSVDEELMRILRNLINKENGVEVLQSSILSEGEDNFVQSGENISIFVPAQNLGSSIGLGIGRVTDTSGYENDNIIILSDIFEIVINEDTKFKRAVEMTIKYDKEKLTDPKNLKIYWFNEIKSRWEYVGGKVDEEKGTITVKLEHFSKYAAIENQKMIEMKDIKGRWSEDIIYKLVSIGVINGVMKNGEYYYEPSRAINRQEFIKLVVSGAEKELGSEKDIAKFADNQKIQEWAVPYIVAAVKEQWVSGVTKSDGIYILPLKKITRAEAATIVGRVLKDLGLNEGSSISLPFKDNEDIPQWAREHVKTLYNLNIITGYPDNTFKPNKSLTREEVAAIIKRMTEYIND